jgi:hypothetical protein
MPAEAPHRWGAQKAMIHLSLHASKVAIAYLLLQQLLSAAAAAGRCQSRLTFSAYLVHSDDMLTSLTAACWIW